MRKNLFLILVLAIVLTACTKSSVNFYGVPIKGTLDEFLTAIDGTDLLDIEEESVQIEYFNYATANCTFMGETMEMAIYAKEVKNEYGDPSSDVFGLTFTYLTLGRKSKISQINSQLKKQYGGSIKNDHYHKNYDNGMIGAYVPMEDEDNEILSDTLKIIFHRWENLNK